jgi:hypothetical protein
MVARNLERGGSFLRPELDTGPFPNYFLVEPPVFAGCAVVVRRATGLDLTAAGRLVSAFGITLAAWGLYSLARRREGSIVGLMAVSCFAALPITVRYGRAFQGDALMLGCLVAGLACWDEFEACGRRMWLAAAWGLLATGLALKITGIYILVASFACAVGASRRWKLILALTIIAPALLWYLHSASLLAQSAGSRAASDSFELWLRVLVPSGLSRGDTYLTAARFLVVRAFTPIGAALALWGLSRLRASDRLWSAWGLSAAAVLLVLAAKWHHEYYWIAFAPLVGVGIARALVDLAGQGRAGRMVGVVLGAGLLSLAIAQTASTWKTPPEWAGLDRVADAVQRHVPRNALVVAPEAVLYAADRHGCRLEFDNAGSRRAAGEWGGSLEHGSGEELVNFYRDHGASFVADLTGSTLSKRRQALHAAIRERYTVLVDQSGVLLARLTEHQGGSDGER